MKCDKCTEKGSFFCFRIHGGKTYRICNECMKCLEDIMDNATFAEFISSKKREGFVECNIRIAKERREMRKNAGQPTTIL